MTFVCGCKGTAHDPGCNAWETFGSVPPPDVVCAPPCPWSWRGMPCALERGHPSPHHIVGEQPHFDAAVCPDPADHALADAVRRLTALWDVVTWELSSGYHDAVWARVDTHQMTFTAEKPTIEEAVAAITAALTSGSAEPEGADR